MSSTCWFVKTTAEWCSPAGQLTSVQSNLSAAQPLYERADLNTAFYQPCCLQKKKNNPKSKIALSALKLWEDKGNAFGEGDVAPFAAAVRGGRSGAADTVIALCLLMYALPLLCWGTAGGKKKHLVSFTEPLNRKYF